MSISLRVGARALLLGGIVLHSGSAPAQTTLSAGTSPYRHVFQQSESIFDKCDDAPRGDLYRKVLTEKVSQCPVSEAEKTEFRSWAAAQSARIADEDRLAHAAGPVPTSADERQCRQLASNPEMAIIRRKLDRYGKGQIGANRVIEEVCESVDQ